MSLNDALAKAAEDLTRRMAENLNRILLATDRPQQLEIFTLPAKGVWVYCVEYRTLGRYHRAEGVVEEWSDWSQVHWSRGRMLPWYWKRADAERALTRYRKHFMNIFGRQYEYRVQPHWHATRPYRRDLDR